MKAIKYRRHARPIAAAEPAGGCPKAPLIRGRDGGDRDMGTPFGDGCFAC